jgi:hypothetical protein
MTIGRIRTPTMKTRAAMPTRCEATELTGQYRCTAGG